MCRARTRFYTERDHTDTHLNKKSRMEAGKRHVHARTHAQRKKKNAEHENYNNNKQTRHTYTCTHKRREKKSLHCTHARARVHVRAKEERTERQSRGKRGKTWRHQAQQRSERNDNKKEEGIRSGPWGGVETAGSGNRKRHGVGYTKPRRRTQL